MFDESPMTQLPETVAAVCGFDFSAAGADQLRVALRAVQTAVDTLMSAHARATGAFESAGGHEQDGCASIGMWLRRELRLSTAEIRRQRRAAAALKWLPLVREAADAGHIRPEHVDMFGTGIAKVGPVVMVAAQAALVPVARESDPQTLRAAVEALHAATDPDGPDAAWTRAQEKQDITCTRAGFGWHVNGFLDAYTGAMLNTALKAWANPGSPHPTDTPAADGDSAEADPDDRPVALRRVEGLHGLLTAYLGSGLPSDKGIRPQLNITVDADTLRFALAGDRSPRPQTRPSLPATGSSAATCSPACSATPPSP